MELIEALKWRYATKKFEVNKEVPDTHILALKDAIQLSASSYGLQLYKVLFISNQDIKEKLKESGFNQDQWTDASHIVIFCHYTNINDKHVDEYLENMANVRQIEISDLNSVSQMIKGSLKLYSEESKNMWAAKQTYIALGTLLAAAAELRIDTCPLEGFNPEEYNKILKLEDQNLSVAVACAIGYRSKCDELQKLKKVRRPKDQLFDDLK